MKSRGIFFSCFVFCLFLAVAVMGSLSASRLSDGNPITVNRTEPSFAASVSPADGESPGSVPHASAMLFYGAGLLGLSGLGRRYLS